MMVKLRPFTLGMAAALTIGLSACGGADDAGKEAARNTEGAAAAGTVAGAGAAANPAGSAPVVTLADGTDVCIRSIVKHLGANTKVSEISSFFSAGKDIDGTATQPAGEMTMCLVEYQNPEDPRKLLRTRLNSQTGQFDPPSQVEIQVMGNAADFKLEDHLIPLSQIDAAPLAATMQSLKPRLDGVYSKYAWTGVRVVGPNTFNATHKLRLDITGRLASNDVKETGYAEVTTDGKTITTDHLTPK